MTAQRVLRVICVIVALRLLGTTALLTQDLAGSVDGVASRARTEHNVAGLSVAVQVGDEIRFAEGYGEADLENHVAATSETVYRIGSITKQFTAAAILKLADAGRLRLDDPVSTQVPDFKSASGQITLHQLLTHTSGLYNYSVLIGDRNRLNLSAEEVVALFENEPLDFAPGQGWNYTNSGYFLLGLVIEHASGTGYPRYIEQELARPHGLNKTVYCDNTRLIENRARGYRRGPDGFHNARPIEMNAPFAAGALCSTVVDLVKWNRALFAGEVIPPRRVRQMVSPVVVNGGPQTYGYGLMIDELNGRRRIHHGGGINGFTAHLAYYPDQDVTVVALTNTGGVPIVEIGAELANAGFETLK